MEAKGHMQREMGNAEVEAAKRKKEHKEQRTSDNEQMKGPLVNQPQRTSPEPGYTATPPSYSTVNNPTTSNPMNKETDLGYTSTGSTSTIDDPTKFSTGVQKN